MEDDTRVSGDTEYESELTAGRNEIAAVLSGVVDGVLTGSIRLGEGTDAVTVGVAEEIELEIELEADDDESNLELELEWAATDEEPDAPPTEARREETADVPGMAAAADASQSLARFEVFMDRAEEWRWRLRHRNGNVIATSGEGYTRKENAQKGFRSVMANSPAAEVIEESTD